MSATPAVVRYGSASGRWVILGTVLGSGMAAIDATVVGIALPSIGREFHASLEQLQWVVTSYSLTLAALLLLGGSLGDRWGRRRVYLIGVVWFSLASAACALAGSPAVLIATRSLQGVGAALLTPGSLAILQSSFAGSDRSRAIGAWSGLGGVATAAGPLLGGYLIAAASWRWIFLINVPLGVLVVWVGLRHIPESSDRPPDGPLDVWGAAIAVLTLLCLSYGLIEGPTRGWAAPTVLASLVGGIVGAAVFLAVEHGAENPMLPIAIFKVRQFTVTNAVTFVVYAALGGVLFLLPVQLQVVDGYSPLEAGVSLLPLTVLMLLLSSRSGELAARIGPRLQMSVGPIVIGLGLGLLARSATDAGYVAGVLPGVLVLGLGLAATVAPLTATALGALPDGHAGLASAVNNDVARLGGLVAVAVLPSLAGITGDSYLHPAQLASGFRTATLIAAACCVAAGVLAAFGLRGRPAPAAAPALDQCFHCALEAAPLVSETSST
ncbi:MAG TPA: DHA2 family efflux MFS transporter permease subunit [Acidimicrobiales bacterium]|nr:DHA2 family efflux MFS transporter permease subunit [Acidimicrobiales bacterium]